MAFYGSAFFCDCEVEGSGGLGYVLNADMTRYKTDKQRIEFLENDVFYLKRKINEVIYELELYHGSTVLKIDR